MFIDEDNEVIDFSFYYTDKNGEEFFDFSYNIKKFNVDDICTDDFARDLIDFVNEDRYDYAERDEFILWSRW